MKTSVRALTLSMTKLLLGLSVEFSRSNSVIISCFLLPVISAYVDVSLCRQYHHNSCLCRHALLFEDMGGEFNIPLAANAKSVREFDEGLTRG